MAALNLYTSDTYIRSITSAASEITAEGGNILVTGGSGLIGSCLVDVLLQANRSFGKSFTVYALSRNMAKLSERFAGSEEVHCIAQSITEPITVSGIDYIVHAASNADPRSYALYPAETILTNIRGAETVLEYCRTHSARALLTSSFEVYGKSEKEEFSESDYGVIDLDLIRNCYPDSKRTAEMLFRAYHDEYRVDCIIARLSSVYGPTMQQNDSKAHAQFLRNALAGENIVLKSKGTQKRSYCYVMDAVSGLLTVLFRGKSGETYNVANDQSAATIAEVAKTVAELSGTEVVYDQPDALERKGFSKPQNCVLKTDKIKSLGWNSKYSLKQGLLETISILEGNRN